jgi:CheY-like chemotaxis protein
MMIEDALTDAGATVIGPKAKLADALIALDREHAIDAVAMDLNLAGVSAMPVADKLAEMNIPFVILTGYGPSGVPERHSHRVIVSKPFSDVNVVQALKSVLNGR